MEKKKSIKKIFTNRVALHILFWIAIVLYSSYLFGYPGHVKEVFIRSLLILPADMVYVYLILYFLIPNYLLKKKYVVFAILFVVLGLADEIVNRFLFYFVYFPENRENEVFLDLKELLNYFAYYYYAILATAIKLFRIWYKKNKETQQIVEEKYQTELKLKEAELKLLKAQVHPHFLFNTLNNLYGLTLEGSKKAPEVVIKLSALLDYVLYKCNTATVSLSSEIGHIINYIDLEKIRYDDSLSVNFEQTGESENLKIAPLLLLPFIENCFKHGVSKSVVNSWIKIKIEIKDGLLHFETENSKINTPDEDSYGYTDGIGLNNVKQRLELDYKNKYSLKIEDSESVFSVILDVNLR